MTGGIVGVADGGVKAPIVTRKEAKAAGLARYSSGEQCKNGHIAERWVADGHCVECARARGRETKRKWRDANPETVKARNAAYRAANREQERARLAAWRAANRDKNKAYNAAYWAANRDKLLAQQAAWVDANRAHVNAYHAAWHAAADPEKHLARCRNRRARKRAAEGSHTAEDVRRINEMQRGRCACCGVKVSEKTTHVDHIVALANGGSNWPNNLQILCASCNKSKGAKDATEFMRSRGRLL